MVLNDITIVYFVKNKFPNQIIIRLEAYCLCARVSTNIKRNQDAREQLITSRRRLTGAIVSRGCRYENRISLDMVCRLENF